MIDMETTLSSPCSLIPRTPVELRELNTRTSVAGKRIARPESVTNMTSSSFDAMRALIKIVSSCSPSNFIAILPLRITFVKSDNLLRRTVPADVAKTTCRSSHSSSGRSTGMIAAIETPVGIGRMFTIALPLAVRLPSGRRHVFNL